MAYFYGDQAPNFWPLVHDVPEKPLLPGLGAGYDYDVVNSDVILNRMSVRDGRITLPDGMSYRVLVLPDQRHMPLEVLVKLEQLVADGATVIGPKPLTVPGMRDHAAQTAQLRTLVDRMWGPCDGTKVTENRHGKGKVVWGPNSRDYLAKQSIGPDFECLDATQAKALDYIHRQTPEADIYFVRNATLKPVHADCRFRVGHHGAPQLWDPADGSVKPLFVLEAVDGGTRVLLDMPPGGSAFVVFEKRDASDGVRSLAATAADPALPAPEVLSLDGGKAVARFWQNGQCTLTDRTGQKHQTTVGQVPPPLVIDNHWTVAFDPEWGAPAQVTFPKLMSWTDHENEGIKYYSGAGVYTRTLDVPADWLASDRGVHLDLGDVRELAEVFVNGKSAGVLWKAPFRADITALVKPGANELKIEVMNLWINRLAGDMNLPPERRLTRTNMSPVRDMGGDETWKVQPAGLLGPVRLLPSKHAKFHLASQPHAPVSSDEP